MQTTHLVEVTDLFAYNISMQVDAIVTSVTKMGFFASVGPLNIFVASQVRRNSMKFKVRRMLTDTKYR